MHAYLITGFDIQKEVDNLLAKYRITPTSLMTLTPSHSHGIESIREIIHYLTLQTAARNENRGVLVLDAHLMTEPAQNAFLKTLEEPPENTIIILAAPREDLLLPTVLSRCILINPQTTPISLISLTTEAQLFEKLKKAGIGEKVQLAEKLGKSRDEALQFVNNQLNFIHSQMHPLGQLEIWSIRNLAKALLSAHHDLSRNVNPKMVLFELLKTY